MADKLAAEIMDAFNEQGGSYKRKEDMHRMAAAVSYTHLQSLPLSIHSLERILCHSSWTRPTPVSYTHLDVYKRQDGRCYHRSCCY